MATQYREGDRVTVVATGKRGTVVYVEVYHVMVKLDGESIYDAKWFNAGLLTLATAG